MKRKDFREVNQAIIACGKCARLRNHCQLSASRKPPRFRDWSYFARPVPNFGDPRGRLLIVGLAPAAHGANRTGRMFTGDRSGDLLYRVLHGCGFASQPTSTSADDGLTLTDAAITAACHCAPPGNRPTAQEMDACSGYLDQTIAAMGDLAVIVCLGRIGFDAVLRNLQRRGLIRSRSAYRFTHGAEHHVAEAPVLLCAYHPSQQNTFTGRLTENMLRQVFTRAANLIHARS